MMMDVRSDGRVVERLRVLHQYWVWILLGGCACAAGALIVSASVPKVYRATTHILISESRIGDASGDTNLQQMAMLATFVPFVDNDALIEESLKALRLDRPPYSLTADLFRRRYLDVRAQRSTRLLELNIEFPDGRLAADLANEIAQGAVRLNDKLNATDTTATQAFLKEQLDRTRRMQADAAAHRLKVLNEAQIEDQEGNLGILLAEKDGLSKRLQQMRLDLVESESRSQSLIEILAVEPEVISLTKGVTSDRFLERLSEQVFSEDAGLSVTEESINETRERIRQSLVDATVDSSAQRMGIEAAARRLGEVNQEISELINRVTVLRSRIEAADQDYALAVEATRNANREYQMASVTVSSKYQDMKQIAPALSPERPVRPNVLVNTAIGFILGIVLLSGSAIGIRIYQAAFQHSVDFGSNHRPEERL